jgi:pilus assembly protein CpaF
MVMGKDVDDIYVSTLKMLLAPIWEFLEDDSISEVMINGPDEVYIERAGRLEKTDKSFGDERALSAAVRNIGQFVGRKVDFETPRMDARLPDGSRVHVIIPPCARKGTYIAIRKFFKEALTVDRLIEFGSITQEAVDFLRVCVMLKKNIIVSGGTGSGKTSLLNVVSSLIPVDERICVIEDSSELQLQQDHVINLETKAPDKKGRGMVTIRELLLSAMRLRPDRIVIGEVRGGEAIDLLQAMTSGHAGSMSTTHANNPLDTLRRLETLALMSGLEIPLYALRSQVASALDLVVQTSRFNDGSRKITHVTEVGDLDEATGNYTTTDIFIFKSEGKDPATGMIKGRLVPTGVKPSFMEEIAIKGLEISEEIFEPSAAHT